MKQEVFFFFFHLWQCLLARVLIGWIQRVQLHHLQGLGARILIPPTPTLFPLSALPLAVRGLIQTRVGSPSLQVSAWPNPSPSCPANSHSSGTSPAWEYAPYRLVKAVDLGGQGHDPGNEECNGGEEGGMGLVAPVVLHLEAWLEDAWSRAFQQEGLRAGALAVWREAGGGKHIHTHTHTQTLFISFYFYFLKFVLECSCFTMLCEFLL